MKPIINRKSFDDLECDAIEFYEENGWVALNYQADSLTCDEIYKYWDSMVSEYSIDIGVVKNQYLDIVSQWRNLWKYHHYFKLILEKPLANLASTSLNLKGVRLLHDHFISKTGNSGNGTVPWHQDSMYWPVDRTGISTWLAMQDTPTEHGCLEVVSGSHLWGASKPIDFMTEQTPIQDSTQTVLLPVKRGDIVLLHSRTWHRSSPTKLVKSIRLAHIALWIPEQTRYWPENAKWHPLNEQISVQKDELLNENEFPVFGDRSLSTGSSLENKHSGVEKPHGMFNARERIEKQIQKILVRQESLGEMLSDSKNRSYIAEVIRKKTKKDDLEIIKTIEQVWISAATFERHRGRNVFNSAYKVWEDIFPSSTSI